MMPLVRRPFPPLPGPTPGFIDFIRGKVESLVGGPVTVVGDLNHPLYPAVKLLERPVRQEDC